MTGNASTSTDEAIEQIRERLEESEKTEITEDEYEALSLGDQDSMARGRSSTIGVRYSLYDVAQRPENIAVKTTTNNSGAKRVRHYATAIGQISIEPAGINKEQLRENLEEDVFLDEKELCDEELQDAVDDLEWGEEETFDVELYESSPLLMEGHTLYTSVTEIDVVFTDPIKRHIDIPDEVPQSVLLNAVVSAKNLSEPTHTEYSTIELEGKMQFNY